MKNILSTLLVLFLVDTSAHASDKIRIAVPEPAAPYVTFPLAHKKAFLTGQGVAAEVILMRNSITVPALNNGDIDYLTPIPRSVQAVIGGFPLKIVACYLPKSTLMVVSRPEINSVKELKGKTVAISGVGSATFAVLQLIAKHFGLDPEKEIRTLGVGTNEARLAALRQGLVSAAVVPPPWNFHAKKLGFHVIARSSELFYYPQVGLITSEKKIKEQSGEIKRVIKAGISANRYFRSNRDGTVQFLREWLRTDMEIAVATYEAFLPAFNEDGNCPEDGMGLVIEEIKQAAKISRQLSMKDVADLSILKEAQRELGIKGK
jgi:NitT/TauT family transport system substrate-binding protein